MTVGLSGDLELANEKRVYFFFLCFTLYAKGFSKFRKKEIQTNCWVLDLASRHPIFRLYGQTRPLTCLISRLKP